MISLLSYLSENYYRPQDQMGFRDPATQNSGKPHEETRHKIVEN